MVWNILLGREDQGYVATVQGMPDIEGRGATREQTLAVVRDLLERHMSAVEVVTMEVDDPAAGYSAAARDLALETARRHGNPNPKLTGKPWIDFAGYLSDMPQEYWDAYQEELRKIREEGNAQETEP